MALLDMAFKNEAWPKYISVLSNYFLLEDPSCKNSKCESPKENCAYYSLKAYMMDYTQETIDKVNEIAFT